MRLPLGFVSEPVDKRPFYGLLSVWTLHILATKGRYKLSSSSASLALILFESLELMKAALLEVRICHLISQLNVLIGYFTAYEYLREAEEEQLK